MTHYNFPCMSIDCVNDSNNSNSIINTTIIIENNSLIYLLSVARIGIIKHINTNPTTVSNNCIIALFLISISSLLLF